VTLNKQKGNMYNFVTHTWNPIRGKCPHNCSYCYMKAFKVGELRLDEKCLKDNLGEGNFIFVGSSTDMFAKDVDSDWIRRVLYSCNIYTKNKYLFQTKNPRRFREFNYYFPPQTILGVTIETNKWIGGISNAPLTIDRRNNMLYKGFKRKMVSIEPIMDFDLDIMVKWMKEINPKFVSIESDSKNHNLPEPSADKVNALIKELKKFTEVKIKKNLSRILK